MKSPKYLKEYKLESDKQCLYEGFDINFNLLTDRDFEILLYRIFKTIIVSKKFCGKYDEVMLMSGTKDHGLDSALFYESKQVGVIQCKKYGKPLNKPICIKEILKFVLYSLVNDDIFSLDIDKSYSYYLVASSGLNNPANLFIGTFNQSIVADPNLREYVEKLISEYKYLSKLRYSEIQKTLLERLSKLKVKLITPVDLQKILLNNNSLISEFFIVNKVVDSSLIKPIEAKLDKLLEEKDYIKSITVILKNFQHASLILKNTNCAFSNINESHIDRPQVNKLFSWINSSTSETIALLVGAAGSGKTVILSDLLKKCQDAGIPTLGLKADRQNGENIKSLNDKLNLSCSIIDSLHELSKANNQVVVIIDQIDALSQYLAAKRDCMDTYIYMINALQNNENVKIIISTREYDFNNDPDIRSLVTIFKARIVRVEFLTPHIVTKVLSYINVYYDNLNIRLKEILLSPVNLDIFCRILCVNKECFNSIQSEFELYNGLWKQITQNSAAPNKTIEFLYNIASDMNQNDVLYVNTIKYEDKYYKEITYLASCNAVSNDEKILAFFHQSFYDFVFAKNFTTQNRDVLTYIIEQEQCITIRARLKIILSYYRECNSTEYIGTISEILFNEEYRYHIKHLVCALLGSQTQPSEDEILLLTTKIILYPNILDQVLVLCTSHKWAEEIFDNDYSNSLLNCKKTSLYIIKMVIFNYLNTDTDIVISYLTRCYEKGLYSDSDIGLFLYALINWTDKAIEFVKRVIPLFNLNSELQIYILQNIYKSNKSFVFSHIDRSILLYDDCQAIYSGKISGYIRNSFFENIMISSPYETCILLCELFYKIIDDKSYGSEKYYKDELLYSFDPYMINSSYGSSLEDLFMILHKQITKYALNDVEIYNEFYNKLKDSLSYSWNLFIASTLGGNFELHSDKIVFILQKALSYNEFGTIEKLHYEYWRLINLAFPLINIEDQKKIAEIVSKIDLPIENGIFEYSSKTIVYPNKFETQYAFLCALPIEYIKENKCLNKHYLELFRKYGSNKNMFIDKEYQSMLYLQPPLDESAYEKMGNQQWINSFYKYSLSYKPSLSRQRLSKGGIREHSSKFKDVVFNNPKKYYELVVDTVADAKIDVVYKINGLKGLLRSTIDFEVIELLYTSITNLNLSEVNILHMMEIAEMMQKCQNKGGKIFEFVTSIALLYNKTKEEKEESTEFCSILQEAAVGAIISFYEISIFHEKIFQVLTTVVENGCKCSRLKVLLNASKLKIIDITMCLNLMKSCLIEIDDEVIKFLFCASNQFLDYFDVFVDIYKIGIESCKDKMNYRNIVIAICTAYFNSKAQASELLDLAILNWGDKAKTVIIEVAFGNFQNQNYQGFCSRFLFDNLSEGSEIIQKAYSDGWYKSSKIDLIQIEKVLTAHINSNSFKPTSVGLYHYLFSQSKKHPISVLKIMNNIDFTVCKGLRGEYGLEDELIKVVLGALNSLRNHDRNHRLIATQVLDNILLNSSKSHYLICNLDKQLL